MPEGPILILEDEILIGLDMKASLEKTRCRKVVIVSSCREANEWLDQQSPALAVLDVRVQDGSSAEIAGRLNEAGIPFLVSSGLLKSDLDIDERFNAGHWLPKPCPDQILVSTAQALLGAPK